MERWTDNINGEPYTSRGVRTVRRRVLGNTAIVIWIGAGYLAYVIVSRKDVTDSIRLSPLNNSRGKNVAHSLKVGQFDRVALKQAAERTFDQAFDYDRELWETFRYANTLKHGTYEQKLELRADEKKEQELRQQQKLEYQQQQKIQQEREQSKKQSRGLTPNVIKLRD